VPMLPAWWVKILAYLQLEPFLSITFILNNQKLVLLFVHNPNVLCYVVLVTSHLHLFIYISVLMCFSSSTCL
jgi:hypothetical protein